MGTPLPGQNHTIRHFALHRIADVELRVISDIETGVIAITDVENEVLCRFVELPGWPHQVVSLFVLSDLSPLQRQIVNHASLPPGGLEGLGLRPVVNLYDLANLSACHVFVNQAAMAKEGYWGDALAETGLLAHEHAHPLTENATTAASRQLRLEQEITYRQPLSIGEPAWEAKLDRLLQVLQDKLVLYAPREIFTNDLVVRSGLVDALDHLDLINVQHAAEGLHSRPALVNGLAAEPGLTGAGRMAMLVLGDLKAQLDLALELASFARQGFPERGQALEDRLAATVFPELMPEVAPAYRALRQVYANLAPDLTAEALAQWGAQVLNILAAALAPYGVDVTARLVRI
jgi:hypothetical protein